jgi:hypothetical protein
MISDDTNLKVKMTDVLTKVGGFFSLQCLV